VKRSVGIDFPDRENRRAIREFFRSWEGEDLVSGRTCECGYVRGLHGGLSTKGESSYMVEDAPTTTEHGHRRCFMGIVQGTVSREVPIRRMH
jgi:hypothetical protein